MLPRSVAAPTEIALSALAGDGTRFVPSLPIATTHTIEAFTASLTRRASVPLPLSPWSPGFSGVEAEPKDMDATCIPRVEELCPQSVF